ncbi:MAG TPA: hypothetical protein VES02_10175 [Dermatophilaceae bacterium]|nr:hypothetical protein [Dermatophilaceae bacterium]
MSGAEAEGNHPAGVVSPRFRRSQNGPGFLWLERDTDAIAWCLEFNESHDIACDIAALVGDLHGSSEHAMYEDHASLGQALPRQIRVQGLNLLWGKSAEGNSADGGIDVVADDLCVSALHVLAEPQFGRPR